MEVDSGSEGSEWEVQIKMGGESIRVGVSGETRVSELKSILQTRTNVLARGQRLIHKGVVLQDDSRSLSSYKVTSASKIMLVASQGLHQGDGSPVLPNFKKFTTKSTTASNNNNNNNNSLNVNPPPPSSSSSSSSCSRWKLTGVVALSHSHLESIPDQVWDCASSARVLDLSHNSISQLPINIRCFTSLQKLLLNSNQFTDASLCWQALTQLNTLSYLSLNHNLLTYLPASLGALTSLEQLHVARNKLATLPEEISHLTRLQILKVNNNGLSNVPLSIGDCSSLTEVDVSSNLLVELPETLGSLQNLKSLRVSNNGLKGLPSSIFKKCVKLSALDLHGTQITMDVLREVEGWEEFDERRRLKYQKQLDFRAGGSAEFDEGADKS